MIDRTFWTDPLGGPEDLLYLLRRQREMEEKECPECLSGTVWIHTPSGEVLPTVCEACNGTGRIRA